MALDNDSVLGPVYMNYAAFAARAKAYFCDIAINGLNPDMVTAMLARASRLVDAHCSRTFTPDSISENHTFNMVTRRVFPNQPPLLSLSEYKIQTAPGIFQGITLTPTTTDAGGNTVSYGAIVYNFLENYLELASLALLTSITPVLISLGISEPQVLITYTSYQNVPNQVIDATGLIAAEIANKYRLQLFMALGAQSVTTLDQSITKFVPIPNVAIPPEAELLLARYVPAIWG